MLGIGGRFASAKGMVRMPDLSGLDRAAAIQAILNSGLKFGGDFSVGTTNASLNSRISNQSIQPNELVDYETVINLGVYAYTVQTYTLYYGYCVGEAEQKGPYQYTSETNFDDACAAIRASQGNPPGFICASNSASRDGSLDCVIPKTTVYFKYCDGENLIETSAELDETTVSTACAELSATYGNPATWKCAGTQQELDALALVCGEKPAVIVTSSCETVSRTPAGYDCDSPYTYVPKYNVDRREKITTIDWTYNSSTGQWEQDAPVITYNDPSANCPDLVSQRYTSEAVSNSTTCGYVERPPVPSDNGTTTCSNCYIYDSGESFLGCDGTTYKYVTFSRLRKDCSTKQYNYNSSTNSWDPYWVNAGSQSCGTVTSPTQYRYNSTSCGYVPPPSCVYSVGPWSAWSSCSSNYYGTKTRTRTITYSSCFTETETESATCCATVYTYGAYGPCQNTRCRCDGSPYAVGTKTRTVYVQRSDCVTGSYQSSASCTVYESACRYCTSSGGGGGGGGGSVIAL